jgi:hypothetical protein
VREDGHVATRNYIGILTSVKWRKRYTARPGNRRDSLYQSQTFRQKPREDFE